MDRFLTVKHNTTLTLLYDLAVAGATIDNDILDVPGVPAYDDQVNSLWVPNYASKKGTVWDSSSAIFLVWLGSNDIYWGYNSTTPDALVSQLMDAYWNTITEKLYTSGARKFYFVAPTSQERAPLMLQAGAANIQKYLQLKWKYSDALVQRLAAFKTTHPDVCRFFLSSLWVDTDQPPACIGPGSVVQLDRFPQPHHRQHRGVRL